MYGSKLRYRIGVFVLAVVVVGGVTIAVQQIWYRSAIQTTRYIATGPAPRVAMPNLAPDEVLDVRWHGVVPGINRSWSAGTPADRSIIKQITQWIGTAKPVAYEPVAPQPAAGIMGITVNTKDHRPLDISLAYNVVREKHADGTEVISGTLVKGYLVISGGSWPRPIRIYQPALYDWIKSVPEQLAGARGTP